MRDHIAPTAATVSPPRYRATSCRSLSSMLHSDAVKACRVLVESFLVNAGHDQDRQHEALRAGSQCRMVAKNPAPPNCPSYTSTAGHARRTFTESAKISHNAAFWNVCDTASAAMRCQCSSGPPHAPITFWASGVKFCLACHPSASEASTAASAVLQPLLAQLRNCLWPSGKAWLVGVAVQQGPVHAGGCGTRLHRASCHSDRLCEGRL